VGIYGVWENRTSYANDWYYHEALFLMFNDVEIFMYVVGASLPGKGIELFAALQRTNRDVPVLSRHLVSRSDPSREPHTNFSSWARHVPDFFVMEPAVARSTRTTTPEESHLGSDISIRALHQDEKSGRDHHEIHLEKGSTKPDS
jgi:hypothetical protein